MRRILSEILLWCQLLYENAGAFLAWFVFSLIFVAALVTAIFVRDWLVAVAVAVCSVCIVAVSRHEIEDES
jgi:hypothetical protein